MKSIAFVTAILMVLSARAGDSPQRLPMTAEDLRKVKRVGLPSVSPDGLTCVVDVTTWDLNKDESSSNLWLLSTDGKTQTQLTNTSGKKP